MYVRTMYVRTNVMFNLTFNRGCVSGKVPAISLKIKERPSSTHTEGVTSSLEVHSRHVMSIVVPQSLNKETREVRRNIESGMAWKEGEEDRMKKKEGKGDYTISFGFST